MIELSLPNVYVFPLDFESMYVIDQEFCQRYFSAVPYTWI